MFGFLADGRERVCVGRRVPGLIDLLFFSVGECALDPASDAIRGPLPRPMGCWFSAHEGGCVFLEMVAGEGPHVGEYEVNSEPNKREKERERERERERGKERKRKISVCIACTHEYLSIYGFHVW